MTNEISDENVCPYCKNKCDNIAEHDEIASILEKNNKISEYVNPGGREFGFSNGKRIQISDHCYHCDLEDIKKEIISWEIE